MWAESDHSVRPLISGTRSTGGEVVLSAKRGLIRSGTTVDQMVRAIGDRIVIPSTIACGSQTEPLTSAIEAYKPFDQRQPGWLKVELEPAMAH